MVHAHTDLKVHNNNTQIPFTGELFVFKSVVNSVLSESTPDKDKGYKLSVEEYYCCCIIVKKRMT